MSPFDGIVNRSKIEEYLSSRKQLGKELRIAGHFLEFLQNEGFPFKCDDFDVVYETSLGHRSKYDKYSSVDKEDALEPDSE